MESTRDESVKRQHRGSGESEKMSELEHEESFQGHIEKKKQIQVK